MTFNNKHTIIITISILLVITTFFLLFPKMTTLAIQEEDNNSERVKLATFAVCEEKEGYTYCKDKIFASCNNILIELNESFFYCEGKRHYLENISLGETYLQNWSDKRGNNLITGWASSD